MHKEGGGFTHQDSLWNSSLRNFFLLLLYALVVVDLNLNKEMTTNQRREKQQGLLCAGSFHPRHRGRPRGLDRRRYFSHFFLAFLSSSNRHGYDRAQSESTHNKKINIRSQKVCVYFIYFMDDLNLQRFNQRLASLGQVNTTFKVVILPVQFF